MLVVRRAKTKKPVVLTIGHSTHTWNDFRDLLRAHRVKRVIDVRSIPRSRHNPQFNRETLSDKAASRGDRLCAFAKARRLAPCATRFAEHGLAQYLISWLCRLYADLRIRSRVTAIDEIGRAEAERNHVCGSSSMALPPFAHRRCADCTWNSGRRHHEHETFPGSFAHSFCTRPRSSHHIPCRRSRRRANQAKKRE